MEKRETSLFTLSWKIEKEGVKGPPRNMEYEKGAQ